MNREAGVECADRLFVQLANLDMLTTVARRGSITAAAQDLYRSPSVITRRVAAVEAALGLDLFERGAGRFLPNWYGKLLIARTRRINDETAAAIAELARRKAAETPHPASLRHMLHDGRKLLLMIHLADARSASGAAGRMGITQSGVSMGLGRLEEALGLRLFHRNLHGMTPTDAGARLILHARRMRAELRHALSELASVGGGPAGVVVIGALPLARTALLPRAIGACLDRAPHVQIEAVEAPGEALIAQLRAGEIDVVLTVPGPQFDPKGLVVERLCDDELVVAAAADHPLARRTGLMLADVVDQDWILPGRHSVSRAAFEEQLAAAGLAPPRPEVQTADLTLIRQLLLDRRDMLALTSRILIEHELRQGIIVALDLQVAPIRRGVVLLEREGVMHSPAVAAVIEQIRSWSAAATLAAVPAERR